ncbi:unnamed protein product [Rotaria sp. Silwood2]|nr:unnamed protein product [Rotaria sp. Silwood2]CAF4328727.1 unnamed protein product [Rotaria sp. Silwood2]CAF4350652.1 unnamed protein product [Rotaria sp. Silwood2]
MASNRYTNKAPHVFSLRFNQDSNVGPTTYAEMLYRTNLIAYVLADHTTGSPSHVVNIYDDQRKTHVLELSFHSSITSIRMSRTRLVVILLDKIHIFSFPSECRLLHTIHTRENPKGLCELSNNNNNGSFIVFPSNAKYTGGLIQILVSIETMYYELFANPCFFFHYNLTD